MSGKSRMRKPRPWRDQSGEKHCFGYLVLCWHEWKGFDQLQAMAARAGMFDPNQLPKPEEVDVFESWDEMIEAMRKD